MGFVGFGLCFGCLCCGLITFGGFSVVCLFAISFGFVIVALCVSCYIVLLLGLPLVFGWLTCCFDAVAFVVSLLCLVLLSCAPFGVACLYFVFCCGC